MKRGPKPSIWSKYSSIQVKIFHNPLVEAFPKECELFTKDELKLYNSTAVVGYGRINFDKFSEIVNNTRKKIHGEEFSRL